MNVIVLDFSLDENNQLVINQSVRTYKVDRSTYLRVKIKSLAEEARIIRWEESRARDENIRNGLTNHRKIDVRKEQRSTLIAYGFLRGKAYKEIEPNAKKPVDWKRVSTILYKYCDFSNPLRPKIDEWIKASQT